MAFQIFLYKTSQKGLDLQPDVIKEMVQKDAALIGCGRDELMAFAQKHMVPAALAGCGFKSVASKPEPEETMREMWLAYRLLKIHYFWSLGGLADHVRNISAGTGISYKDVAAIAYAIAAKHLRDELENREGDVDFGEEPKR